MTIRSQLLDMLRRCPREGRLPRVVVLTPGIYNSAYFEHSFWRSRWASSWSRPDLVVGDDDCVYMRTTRGPAARRRDLPAHRRRRSSTPRCFRPDSVLGVPGLMRA